MKLLEDNQGNFSSNRVIKLIVIVWAAWITSILLLAGGDPITVGGFFVAVLTAVSGLTAYAKKKETESEKIEAEKYIQSIRPVEPPIKKSGQIQSIRPATPPINP